MLRQGKATLAAVSYSTIGAASVASRRVALLASSRRCVAAMDAVEASAARNIITNKDNNQFRPKSMDLVLNWGSV